VGFFPVYAFDLDGTLYRGNEVISGAVEAISTLIKADCQVLYVTNNSSLTVDSYVEKLTQMGFPAQLNQVITSATATAKYCQEQRIQSAFVVGEPGLVRTLQSVGITVVNSGQNSDVLPIDVALADAVVCGICRDQLSYRLLDCALHVLNTGARLIATNADKTFPLEAGRLSPGAGTLVAALTTCSGKTPVIVGKPNPTILTSYFEANGIQPRDVCVVGDRLDTDIECGVAAGCHVSLVLSGVVALAPEHLESHRSVAELVANHARTV
jgi:HAD superfamily hydrolase (TIGR01450 family)